MKRVEGGKVIGKLACRYNFWAVGPEALLATFMCRIW